MEYNKNTQITLKEIKETLSNNFYTDARVVLRDVTEGNSQGYDFAIVKERRVKDDDGDYYWKAEKTLLKSFIVWDSNAINIIKNKGSFKSVFDRAKFNTSPSA